LKSPLIVGLGTIWDGFGVSGARLDSSNAACTTRLACSIVPEGGRFVWPEFNGWSLETYSHGIWQ